MGTAKMLLPWDSETVLGRVAETLLQTSVTRIVVVLGHRAAEVRRGFGSMADDPRIEVVVNQRYSEGMLTSIQCGAARALPGDLVVALGDQPLISPSVVERLLACGGEALCVPSYGGRRGHPVRVPADLVSELLALPADVGMRGLFQAHPDRVRVVEVDCAGVLVDLDTPADYLQHRPAAAEQPRAAG